MPSQDNVFPKADTARKGLGIVEGDVTQGVPFLPSDKEEEEQT